MRWLVLVGVVCFSLGALAQEQPAAGEEAPPPAPELEEGMPPIAPEPEEERGEAELEAPGAPEEAAGGVEAVEVPGEEEEAVEAAAPEEAAPPTDVEKKPASVARVPFRPRERELEPTIMKGLKAGESTVLSVDKVRGEQEVVSLVTTNVTLEFLLTSDGLFRTLKLSGQEGEGISFELAAGPKTLAWDLVVGKGAGRISCCPVSGFTAAAGQGSLALKLETFTWAFELAAEDVGAEGVEIRCEGLTGALHNGQQLNSRRDERDEIVFVISGMGWPREYTPWELARIKWEDGPRPADEPRQPMYSPLRPWQTLFLPTIELEVLRPEDVSP